MKNHDVYHPNYGVVDQIRVDGMESAEELKQFETKVFERLVIAPSGMKPLPAEHFYEARLAEFAANEAEPLDEPEAVRERWFTILQAHRAKPGEPPQ